LIIESHNRNVVISGLATTKMQVEVDAQTIKNLIANYSKPHESCIRELCVNAYEAHYLAGKADEPFHLHVPTKLEPWVSVQDFGIGMSENEIKELYSVIGKSSKRDTNDLAGAFGVGSKAAYAITNMFTIQSTYNGKRFSYICHLDSQGIPCLSEAPENGIDTDDPNGFLVKFDVPSGEYRQFIEGIKPALAHFKTKPTISGTIVEWDKKEVAIEGTDYKVFKAAGSSNHYSSYRPRTQTVIMGQIGYPVDLYDTGVRSFPSYSFQLTVPIGSVDINSSRETLQYTDRTKKAIKERFRLMQKDIESKVDGLIDGEPCAWDKGVKSKDFNRLFSTAVRYPPVFGGKTIQKYRVFVPSNDPLPLVEIKKLEHGGVRFVLDDLKRGTITLSRALCKEHGATVIIPEDGKKNALAEFGILDSHLIKASSLPKNVVVRTSSGKSTEKIQILQRGQYTRISHAWKDSTVATIKPVGLYCDLSSYKTIFQTKELKPTDLNLMLEFLEGYNVHIPTVYGIKKGATPEPGWKPLDAWLYNKCKSKLQEYVNDINTVSVNMTEFNRLKEFFDLSSIKPSQRKRDYYTTVLRQWFKMPAAIIPASSWDELQKECFYYNMFRQYLSIDAYKEAFIELSKIHVKSFKLLESK
jgi:hypothetical protein